MRNFSTVFLESELVSILNKSECRSFSLHSHHFLLFLAFFDLGVRLSLIVSLICISLFIGDNEQFWDAPVGGLYVIFREVSIQLFSPLFDVCILCVFVCVCGLVLWAPYMSYIIALAEVWCVQVFFSNSVKYILIS